MKQQYLENIKNQILPILKDAGVTRAAIFGSTVRGENMEKSDLDILVDYPKGTTLFDVAELQYKLEDILGKPVDLVGY
jgi:predicted nucleotidyltransferase